jgi:nitrogen fixation protein FixH
MKEKGKSRWGVGLVTAFVIFVVVMLGVAGFLMMQDVNLVADTYYEKELQYQNRIHAMERTRALGSAAGIERSSTGLIVRFPHTMPMGESAGKIVLYRPADRSADRTLPVAPDSLRQQHIVTASLAPGLWRCQVSWTMDREDYYLEQPFMVP